MAPRTLTLDLMEADGVTPRSRRVVEANPFYDMAGRLGCCKLFHPAYMHAYWSLWNGFRLEPFRLLEIGVEVGRSLRLWEEAFPKAEITAVDCDRDCLRFDSARSFIYLGRQEDAAFLSAVADTRGPFRIVVDDGSHEPAHQLASLTTLWPHVEPGGWYAVEDFPASFGHSFLKDWSADLPNVAEMHYYPDLCVLRKSIKE